MNQKVVSTVITFNPRQRAFSSCVPIYIDGKEIEQSLKDPVERIEIQRVFKYQGIHG